MFIITTSGLNNTEDKTRKMILAGADAIRINLSRHTLEENISLIKTTKEIISELHSNVKILIDMPLNKIRLGDFDIKIFAVRENEEFVCKSATYTSDCNQFIPIHTHRLGEKVCLNQVITVGDGEIALQVTEVIDSETIKVKMLNNGIIEYHKTFNIKPELDGEEIFKKTTEAFHKIEELEPDFITISYLNSEHNERIKQFLQPKIKRLQNIQVIIKIEDENGVRDIHTILQDPFYNMLILDRGEIGVNLPFKQVGVVQRQLIDMCKRQGKRLIISTQILESTINCYTPNRAEISDLTNIVISGAYGIMFCRETGINTRPAYTISVAKKIIDETKRHQNKIVI